MIDTSWNSVTACGRSRPRRSVVASSGRAVWRYNNCPAVVRVTGRSIPNPLDPRRATAAYPAASHGANDIRGPERRVVHGASRRRSARHACGQRGPECARDDVEEAGVTSAQTPTLRSPPTSSIAPVVQVQARAPLARPGRRHGDSRSAHDRGSDPDDAEVVPGDVWHASRSSTSVMDASHSTLRMCANAVVRDHFDSAGCDGPAMADSVQRHVVLFLPSVHRAVGDPARCFVTLIVVNVYAANRRARN